MSVNELDTYINTIGIDANSTTDVIDAIDVVEGRITENDKFPVVKDNKTKKCCRNTLEFVKVMITFFKYNLFLMIIIYIIYTYVYISMIVWI